MERKLVSIQKIIELQPIPEADKIEVATGFIYKITNKINGKVYIGKSTYNNIEKLINRYSKEIRFSKWNRLIIRAFKKYGFDNFVFEIIESGIINNKLSELEIKYIKLHQSNNRQYGYNLTIGGEGTVGLKWNNISKQKLSKKMIGKYIGENNPFYGKHHSHDVVSKIIESNHRRKGIKTKCQPESVKRKISLSKMGSIPWNKGKKYPQISGENNPNYKKIDCLNLIKMVNGGKKYKEICNVLNIAQSCFYRKLKEFNLERSYYATTS
jgi:group I intron endonuclease